MAQDLVATAAAPREPRPSPGPSFIAISWVRGQIFVHRYQEEQHHRIWSASDSPVICKVRYIVHVKRIIYGEDLCPRCRQSNMWQLSRPPPHSAP